MTPERWQRVDEIFQAAIELTAEERPAFVERACAGDEELRREVESLITSDEQGLSLVDEPALQVAAGLLATGEPELAEGQSIGHFEIVGLIGRGGMGEVYLATDTLLNRRVALKLLPAAYTGNKDRLRRFQQEAQAASALNHPNILTIYELGQVNGQQFIATEFVEGETLRQRLKRAPLNFTETLDIAIQIGSALATAHNAGIVHRDIKPENLMLRRDGYVKVLDFGLAKLTEQHEPTTRVQAAENVNISSGLVLGTVKYMSPEQARGQQVDVRSDIFSFGVVLYEMLAGRAPFEGDSSSELIAAILNKEPPPLTGVQDEMKRLVNQALCKKKEERYQTIQDLLGDLKSLHQDKAAAGGGLQMATATTASSALSTSEAADVSTGSTFESVVSGIKRHLRSITFGALAMVVVAAAALYFSLSKNEEAITSLAILPFVNVSSDSNVEYLSDGIADQLTNTLSRLPGVTVRSSSAAARYKVRGSQAGGLDVQAVGRALKVEAVVVGKLLQQGDSIHVSAELVEVITNRHLWGEEYKGKLSDLLSIEEGMAKSISARLRPRLTNQQEHLLAKRHTENPAAYTAYVKGRYYWNKRNEQGMRKAIEQFHLAVNLDPTYALAYTGLADTYAILGSAYYDPLPPKADMPKAREAALRAVELDDTLAEAHSALAIVLGWYDWDWAGAERELKRAIELQPRYATARQSYAWYLMAMGRLDEALAEMRLAQECDPISLIIGMNVGTVLYCRRQYDEALGQFQKTAELDPNFRMNHVWPGMAYLEKSAFSEAIAEFKQEKAPWEQSVWMLGMTYARMGQKDAARKILNGLQELAQQRYVSPSAFILIHTGLGEKDEAFAWLDKACQERDFDLCLLKVDPKLDSLRADPRFARILQRVGLAQ